MLAAATRVVFLLQLAAIASQAVAVPPDSMKRMDDIQEREEPIVGRLIQAARNGDDAEFAKYVAPGTVIDVKGSDPVPFTAGAIHDLAQRCADRSAIGIRALPNADELSIYWRCPGQGSSPMTSLLFENGKITHAETGPAIVYVAPPAAAEVQKP
ncbi:MAG: hypothetical protein ACXWIO_05230 [Croceibacterium sp.]